MKPHRGMRGIAVAVVVASLGAWAPGQALGATGIVRGSLGVGAFVGEGWTASLSSSSGPGASASGTGSVYELAVEEAYFQGMSVSTFNGSGYFGSQNFSVDSWAPLYVYAGTTVQRDHQLPGGTLTVSPIVLGGGRVNAFNWFSAWAYDWSLSEKYTGSAQTLEGAAVIPMAANADIEFSGGDFSIEILDASGGVLCTVKRQLPNLRGLSLGVAMRMHMHVQCRS